VAFVGNLERQSITLLDCSLWGNLPYTGCIGVDPEHCLVALVFHLIALLYRYDFSSLCVFWGNSLVILSKSPSLSNDARIIRCVTPHDFLAHVITYNKINFKNDFILEYLSLEYSACAV